MLVALLVVGITLLGLGMAQNQALKNTRQSEYRSLAIYLANDMADRIRANPTGLRDGHFNSLTGAAIHWNCERAVGCSAEQMAQHDKYRWQMLLDELLPSGEGALVIDDQLVTITVTWQQREETGNEPHSHILKVRV